jgi:endo-1,4-beta-xylanase
MKQVYIVLTIASAAFLATSCKKDKAYTPDTINADTTLTLKAAAPFQLGVGVDNGLLLAGGAYTNIVQTQFSAVTAGYVMKHGAIVQNNGALNFTTADNFVTWAAGKNMAINGHTLSWYQNNNGNYLRALVALPSSAPAPNPNLVANGSFEQGTATTQTSTGAGAYGSICTNWTAQVQGASNGSVSLSTVAGEFNNETRGAKIVVNTAPANGYEFQLFPDGTGSIPTLVGGTGYKVGFYAKHSGATTPKIRVQTQAGGYVTNDVTVTTTWTKYSVTLTPSGDATRFNFQFLNTGTFFIDSVSVTLANPGAGGVAPFAELKLRIDTTYRNFISSMVNHFKDKVHAWDVVNEPVDENGVLRTGTSSSDAFYWGNYLGDRNEAGNLLTNGDSMIAKAFIYARAADPSAKLFINDYNLEGNARKTDSLIALIKRLRLAGVPIDGVGLQMHIAYNTPTTDIDNALMKFGALGILVKISELDVRVNMGSATDPNTKNYVLAPTTLAQQAAVYRNVAESYIKIIPAARRFGITVWGVGDKDSWLRNFLPYHTVDYPLLYDDNYNKKPAFNEFLTGLQLK